jgi:Flp pilus assembly protein TadG
MKRTTARTTPSNDRAGASRPRRDGGQVIVLFALGAVAIIAMVGLVLDGGGAFAQRRNEQNAADVAAMAGANAYLNTPGTPAVRTTAARAAARAAATRNGYTDGVGRASVSVDVALLSKGGEVTVRITAPHDNAFARIPPIGQDTWDISVAASAEAGIVDTANAAGPWTMSIEAFNADGSPKFDQNNPQSFGEAGGDYPSGPLDMAWTDYNGSANVDSNEVRDIVDGTNVINATFDFDQYLGQHNQGVHNTVYTKVNSDLAGVDVPIPIVGPGSPTCSSPTTQTNGCFKGWAIFHVVSAQGGSDKTITGYFKGTFRANQLTVGECTPAQQAANQCGLVAATSPFDNYVVRLTN